MEPLLVQPKLDGDLVVREAAREAFIAEAVARAEAAGYYPAQFQRDVDWESVYVWSRISAQADFAWADANDRSVDGIVVGPGPDGVRAVHAGQHRILGGLMSGNPVPASSITWLSVPDATKGWLDAAPTVDDLDLLALLG